MTVKRLNSSPYFSPSFAKLEEETILNLSGAQMIPSLSDKLAEILITNTHTRPSEINSAQLAACRLMIHPNSGYDNFSAEFIANSSFPIILGNSIRSNAVANFILAALFAHYTNRPAEANWNEFRKWPRKLISELNILILGKGLIGNILEKSLTPLAKQVRIYDPYEGYPDLDLTNVDVLIPACSLNSKNIGMIDKAMLLALNPDFLLINAARGALVKTLDLIDVLTIRENAFSVLDVFEKEPADFLLFKDLKKIKLSSHIAGVYSNIDLETARFEALVIKDFKTLKEADFNEMYKSQILKNRLQLNHLFLI